MGFVYKSLSQESCSFTATAEGADSDTFLQCVQQALKQLQLEILIDVSGRIAALGAVLPHLLKLQKVVSSHGKHVTITGLDSAPGDFRKRLNDLGIQTPVVSLASPPPQPEVAQSVIATEAPPQTPSRVGGNIETRFKYLKDQLMEALKRKKFLANEKRTYEERIKSLRAQSLSSSAVDHKQISEIVDLEGKAMQLRSEKAALQRKIEEVEKKKSEINEENGKKLSEAQKVFGEKKRTLDQKLAELVKKREKFVSDYKKKKETRAAQKARLDQKSS